MKRITRILLITVFVVISSYIVANAFTIDEEKEDERVEIKKKEDKKDYEYITLENDNIENLLQDPVINKVIEKSEEVKEIIEPEKEIEVKNGFIEEDNNTYYYENNNKITGEKEIDGNIYLFDENGIMQKDIFVNKKYFNENGILYIGFKDIDDKTYYFSKDGYLVGINEIDNNIYNFNQEGILQKDIVIDNCYYDTDGKLYTGFKDIDSYTYYFTKDGFKTGLFEVDNKKYYSDENGHLIKNTFYDKYYLDEEGCVVTGERKIGDRIYIFDEEGKLLNGFQEIDGKKYFIDENNNKLKGVHLINDVKYYFDFETGELLKENVKSVIDISSWQGDIDFDEVKRSSLVDGVIVRVGYGTTISDEPVLDNKFESNIRELNRLEIPYGIYIFGYAQNENASTLEANFVNEMIKKYDVKLSYPIFYDAELQEFEGVKYTKSMYKKVINNFINKLNEYGYKDVGVYGNLYMLTSGGLSSLQKRIPKWVAQYHTRCEYDSDYIGWQYTSDGSIPGINGRVDMNIFY